MDAKLVFVKTPLGDEAVRQSTRVVQRNLRMVLVQVDGKLSVAELSAKIGNPRLVEGALRDLEEGGFIAPKQGAAAVLGREENKAPVSTAEKVSAISQFSSFGGGSRVAAAQNSAVPASMISHFSSFGKPILPASGQPSQMPPALARKQEREHLAERFDLGDKQRSLFSTRWLWALPVGLLAFLVLFVLLYPYEHLRPQIELATSRLLQSPVHVESVGISFWPRPALTLGGVTLGDAGEGTIELVRVASPLSLLGSEHHVLSGIDVIGATLPADFLVSSRLFKMPVSPVEGRLQIKQLSFSKLNVTARDLAIRDLSGELVFKADGSVEKAAFQNIDLGIRFAATPTSEGVLLDIEGFGWKPLGASLGFDSLQAKGLLQKGKLVVQSFDTTFLNGILKGSWLLDWSGDGLAMAGDASLQRLDCRKMSVALVPTLKLEGELGGSLRLRATGKDWDGLWHGLEARLDADITRGVLHGVDLGEAVRGGAGYIVRSGSTKFDRLRTSLIIDSRQVSGRDVQMSAGMLTANGQFVIGRDRPLDANLVVSMQTSVSTVRAPVHVTGVLPNLTAVSGK